MAAMEARQPGIALAEFLARPLFAHLATASKAGPATTPLWFLWEGGSIWLIGNAGRDAFLAHVLRESRCAISMVDFDREHGLVQQVELRGRAVVERWDQARACRLLRRYLGPLTGGWDPRLRTQLDNDANVLVRFVPQQVSANDGSYAALQLPSP